MLKNQQCTSNTFGENAALVPSATGLLESKGEKSLATVGETDPSVTCKEKACQFWKQNEQYFACMHFILLLPFLISFRKIVTSIADWFLFTSSMVYMCAE